MVSLSQEHWELCETVSEVLVEVQRGALALEAAKAFREWGDGCCILPMICTGNR